MEKESKERSRGVMFSLEEAAGLGVMLGLRVGVFLWVIKSHPG